mgnify:CR=1 FL=1
MTDASGKTFQQLYDGTSTLAKYVERYWVAVAAYFRGHDGVLAYELYHLAESGYDFYGEGMDLFDEGGVTHHAFSQMWFLNAWERPIDNVLRLEAYAADVEALSRSAVRRNANIVAS